MNENQVRDHVHKLRRFYTDALIYAVVNIGLILIWAISGGGYFWPIWVIIGWGIGLGIHAFSLGLIPQMNALIPFTTAAWEDEQVRRLMEAGYKGKEKAEERARVKAELKAAEKGEEETATVTEEINVAKPGDKSKAIKTKILPTKTTRVTTLKKPKV